ncbi:MAG TPA: 16S rRNA (adenine(1518)-N(6)/adenine(1519)-N(6))-dimethyltransferase RsmA, partial [Synergistaceae bacterium]|nr:16S rRNA (adenine(1518)-N(6)/adenine(1519)-N(6))-dimethyltransferase RsmA [Synergistaceae bacterium]
NILLSILEQADLSEKDTVLEIGAGQGVLTRELAASKCSFLFSVEIDEGLSEFLRDITLLYPNTFSLLWRDALAVNYSSLSPAPTKVVANIPYNITTPLLWRLLEQLPEVGTDYFLLMVQKEAAERITAPPGTKERYPLGITLELMGKSRSVQKVHPRSFRPAPAVESSLLEIRLSGQHTSLPKDILWRSLLRSSFAQRRKKLSNNLRVFRPSVCWNEAFESSKVHENARAEELTAEQWVALWGFLKSIEKKNLSPE